MIKVLRGLHPVFQVIGWIARIGSFAIWGLLLAAMFNLGDSLKTILLGGELFLGSGIAFFSLPIGYILAWIWPMVGGIISLGGAFAFDLDLLFFFVPPAVLHIICGVVRLRAKLLQRKKAS